MALVRRKMSTRSDSPAKLGIQAFYSSRGVDDPADIVWKREEWDDLRPVSPPGLGDGRIFLAPCAFGKVFEGELTGIGVLGLVDLLQRRGNRLAVLVRDEGERMADEMDDAGLHLGLRKDSGDRLRKALQAVDDGDQHVLDAAAFQLVHHPEPELRALRLLDPKSQDFLRSVRPDAKGNIDRLVADGSLVAHLDADRIEENQRVESFERPVLPVRHLLQNGIGDGADQVGGNLDAVQLTQMPLDFTGAHAAGVHRDDLLVEAGKPPLVLGDQPRIEGRQPIPGNLEIDLGSLGQHPLPAVAVAAIDPAVRFASLQVMIDLRVQRPLGQSLLQLIQQAVLLARCFRIRSGQQLIQHLIRNNRLFASCHTMSPLTPSELHPVSVDTTLSKQEPRGAEGWTKRSKVWMWRLGLWAARASSARPRCPQPTMIGRWHRWRRVCDGAWRASASWCCG